MRIFDNDNEQVLRNVSIFLTLDEAREMVSSVESLIRSFKSDADHIHLNDDTFQHEITLCLYDEANLKSFNARAKILIQDNK